MNENTIIIIMCLSVLFLFFLSRNDGRCLTCGKKEKGVFRGSISQDDWFCNECKRKENDRAH